MMNGPNKGMKGVVRCPEQCHIWWIDDLWSKFYSVTWETTMDVDVL